MKELLEAPFIKEIARTCSNMYRLGWDERNAGNLSLLLEDRAIDEYLDAAKVIRVIDLKFDASPLLGKTFVVSGTGKYFKNVEYEPEVNLGILRISGNGSKADLLWGLSDGGGPTSELPAHLMSHIERLKVDPLNRVVTHCHATNLVAMTYVHSLDECAFTRTLWKMSIEAIVVFPDGVSVLPWMLCGTESIGRATAEKMRVSRLCVWAHHGIFGAGKTLDEAFGLIETVEKAATLYTTVMNSRLLNTISDEQLRALADAFNVPYRTDYLDPIIKPINV
ncbi:MAG: rhamnulose-1-phosphate aldolase [Treponema sp.]|jgi:rhamnulose-1-phosphate aldolase|nr:rhamnulose-1-phosphate aldolase [Treponema sp.]